MILSFTSFLFGFLWIFKFNFFTFLFYWFRITVSCIAACDITIFFKDTFYLFFCFCRALIIIICLGPIDLIKSTRFFHFSIYIFKVEAYNFTLFLILCWFFKTSIRFRILLFFIIIFTWGCCYVLLRTWFHILIFLIHLFW